MNVLISFLILLFYIFSFLFYFLSFIKGVDSLKKWAFVFLIFGYALHTCDVFTRFFMFHTSLFSQGKFYFNLLAWCFLSIYLILFWKFKTSFLALTISPISTLVYISSLTINTNSLPYPYKMRFLWFLFHVTFSFFSISLMAVAFGAGILYVYLDKQLKNKVKPSNFRKKIPSLMAIDNINKWAVLIGFPLFTIGMFSGFIWAGFTWGRFFSADPKEIISIIIWLFFAYLFHQRFAIGWKGKKTAVLAIWLFLLSLFSLVIINFYIPTHHSFTKVLS